VDEFGFGLETLDAGNVGFGAAARGQHRAFELGRQLRGLQALDLVRFGDCEVAAGTEAALLAPPGFDIGDVEQLAVEVELPLELDAVPPAKARVQPPTPHFPDREVEIAADPKSITGQIEDADHGVIDADATRRQLEVLDAVVEREA